MAAVLAAARPVSSVSRTKRPRAPRTSEADEMATSAEQLWSGKTRGYFAFESIAHLDPGAGEDIRGWAGCRGGGWDNWGSPFASARPPDPAGDPRRARP